MDEKLFDAVELEQIFDKVSPFLPQWAVLNESPGSSPNAWLSSSPPNAIAQLSPQIQDPVDPQDLICQPIVAAVHPNVDEGGSSDDVLNLQPVPKKSMAKRGRKRVYTQEQDKKMAHSRNELRYRMNINDGIEKLRNKLFGADMEVSKADILHHAAARINTLEAELGEAKAMIDCLQRYPKIIDSPPVMPIETGGIDPHQFGNRIHLIGDDPGTTPRHKVARLCMYALGIFALASVFPFNQIDPGSASTGRHLLGLETYIPGTSIWLWIVLGLTGVWLLSWLLQFQAPPSALHALVYLRNAKDSMSLDQNGQRQIDEAVFWLDKVIRTSGGSDIPKNSIQLIADVFIELMKLPLLKLGLFPSSNGEEIQCLAQAYIYYHQLWCQNEIKRSRTAGFLLLLRAINYCSRCNGLLANEKQWQAFTIHVIDCFWMQLLLTMRILYINMTMYCGLPRVYFSFTQRKGSIARCARKTRLLDDRLSYIFNLKNKFDCAEFSTLHFKGLIICEALDMLKAEHLTPQWFEQILVVLHLGDIHMRNYWQDLGCDTSVDANFHWWINILRIGFYWKTDQWIEAKRHYEYVDSMPDRLKDEPLVKCIRAAFNTKVSQLHGSPQDTIFNYALEYRRSFPQQKWLLDEIEFHLLELASTWVVSSLEAVRMQTALKL